MEPQTTASVEPFYWDNFTDTTMGRYLSQRELAFIKRLLCVSQPRRVLEVAAGSGRITFHLPGSGREVVALDMDSVAQSAFQRRSQAIPLVRGDAHKLPFSDGSFDCVVAIQCFQFFYYESFLQECNRVLDNGGLLIFQSLNHHNYKRMLRRLLRIPGEAGPSGNLSCREVLRATVCHGFDIKAVSGYYWFPLHRNTNSRLVNPAATIERMLRLDRIPSISPWLLVAGSKRTNGFPGVQP